MADITHLGQAARRAAARFGDRDALVSGGRTFSFAQLNDLVERMAAGLAAAGVVPGDVVTLYAGNSWEWILSYYAIARAGGVINPVSTMLLPAEVAFVVDNCKASAIIPKGAMQSHRAVITIGAMTAQMQMRGPDDVIISALPCPHVYANVVMQSMMFYGAKLILHARFDPAAFLADIAGHKATIIDGVPTMYMYLLNAPELATTNLSSLRRAYVGGQTMPVATMQRAEAAFGTPLIELWDMTEIAGLGATHPLYGRNRHGSIGVALPYCELRVCDPDHPETTLPPDEAGELQVRGPITMMGYFGDNAKTAETLLPSGWLRTGDMARKDVDGCVFTVDRLKDMIITGGFNVYPAEIERVLAGHPDVALCAVGKRADEMKGEIAVAFIVPRVGAAQDKAALLAFCRDHLAAYKCLCDIRFVADVPKTSTGKIMRRELHTLDRD